MNGFGRTRVTALASRLGPPHFDVAYSSPLARARETASMLLTGSAASISEVADITELGYGMWQGSSPSDWPGGAAAVWERDPWAVDFPGGESLTRLRERACPAIARIIGAHPGCQILVSGHGHCNRVMLIDGLALDVRCFWQIRHPNASCYRIEYRREGSGQWAATNATLITCGDEESASWHRPSP
jgi:broad specificity phosphatase PhoE